MGLLHLSATSTVQVSETQASVPAGLRAASYWMLALVFAAVFLGSLFSPPLLDDADSTHAEAAREMFLSGDYVTLHINGVRYLEKAPLPYWLVVGSYHLFGINEFSTRLPMAISVLLLGVLALIWARRAFGERAGIYAALFVYTAVGVFLFTRILIPDVLLSVLIAAPLYFFLTALESRADSWRWYAGYACIALGVLTKGLIALAFPGGAAFIYLAATGEWHAFVDDGELSFGQRRVCDVVDRGLDDDDALRFEFARSAHKVGHVCAQGHRRHRIGADID